MKLSAKEQYCMKQLLSQSSAGWSIARTAAGEGVNKAICRLEWADAPLRSLRAKGLVEWTGEKDRMGGNVCRLTASGQDWITQEATP